MGAEDEHEYGEHETLEECPISNKERPISSGKEMRYAAVHITGGRCAGLVRDLWVPVSGLRPVRWVRWVRFVRTRKRSSAHPPAMFWGPDP
jgi:hypothetical protein